MIELLSYVGGVIGNVKIIEKFMMPQLSRERKIWIYLPRNYDESKIDYPVLYMHDGQNLFAPETSFCGEWSVDDTLEALSRENCDRGIIVVGIESGTFRNQELSPGCIDCDHYVDFIVETLKPYIDANFRTCINREQTGIMGSSFGGQTSIYAALKYPAVFGLVGALSPSLYLTADTVICHPIDQTIKCYICAGESEAAHCDFDIATRFTPNVCEVANALKDCGHNVKLIIDEDGQHNEAYWARKFPEAYEYLFG
ncbi:MAG: alpha/beta hydrolase-fold protein [Negativicutes bacterium]|jgi:predicted alpha/beta superfamily hydrolase